MKKVIVFLLVFTSLILRAEFLEGLEVVKVIDGDTVHAIFEGKLHKIRLTEIDAPENNQPGGKESSVFLSSLLAEGFFNVEFFGKDRYGRDLGRIFVNEKDINRLMVKSGMAWVYDDYVTEYSFYNDQNAAKINNSGLWNSDNPIPPWKWRNRVKSEKTLFSTSSKKFEQDPINKSCCKICKKGKACGNSCIKATYRCSKPPGCACNG